MKEPVGMSGQAQGEQAGRKVKADWRAGGLAGWRAGGLAGWLG